MSADKKRRFTPWKINIEHAVYDHACKAMESRPDYPEIEKLWTVLDERFKFMRYDYDPEKDDDLLHETDLTELSLEAGIEDESCLSHLRTMQGAGLILAFTCFQGFNTVSVVIAPHMVAS